MAKNGRLPKRIAGVKIPKKLRKNGGAVYELVNRPMVRNILADMIAAGLMVAADRIARQPPVKKAGKKAKHAAVDAGEAATASAGSVATILALAARETAKAIKSR